VVTNLSNVELTSDGSNTPRLLKDRFAEYVNVKDFGATGDGSPIDDTTAINAAITHAKENYWDEGLSATLYFPSGQYWCGNDIKTFEISHDYAYSELISIKGDGISSMLWNGGFIINVASVELSDMSFYGNNTGSAVELISSAAKCRIRNLFISRYEYGIFVNNCKAQNQIESTRVRYCTGAGFYILGVYGTTLIGCQAHNCHTAPGFFLKGYGGDPANDIPAHPVGECRMISCRAQHCREGLKIDGTDSVVYESYFDNLSLSWNGWRDPSKRVSISDASLDGEELTVTFTSKHYLRDNSFTGIGQSESEPGLVLAGQVSGWHRLICKRVISDTEAVIQVDSGFVLPSGINSENSYMQPAYWDLYIDNAYDLWFTQCNINHSYFNNLRETRFNNSRLKMLIYFDSSGTSTNNVFYGNRRGRSVNNLDVIPHGPGSVGAWASFELGRENGDASISQLHMDMPKKDTLTNADGTPQDFSGIVVKPDGIELQGLPTSEPSTVGEIWNDDGIIKIKEA